MASGRHPSAPRLLAVLVAACLLPALVYGLVGPGSGGGDVRTGGSTDERASADGDGDAVDVRSAEGDGSGGGGGEGRTPTTSPTTEVDAGATPTSRPATTSTSEAPATTAPPAEPEPTEAPTTTAPPAEPEPTTPPTTEGSPPEAGQVLALVNDARAAASCPPLRIDDRLATAARLHSEDMAARTYFDHLTPEGQDPTARAQAQGYDGGVGENIAQGYPDAEAVMEGWMGSDGHRANIENCDYTVIGIGVETDGWYWTQVFGL